MSWTVSKDVKIPSLVFVDEYEIFKDILPEDTSIMWNSSKDEIANAIFDTHDLHCAKLFSNRSEPFMNRSGVQGDILGETFYLHNLKYHMPHIMRDTYNCHRLGSGIFTMEVFQY